MDRSNDGEALIGFIELDPALCYAQPGEWAINKDIELQDRAQQAEP